MEKESTRPYKESGRVAQDFDGNTLLLQKSATKYIFVAWCPVRFSDLQTLGGPKMGFPFNQPKGVLSNKDTPIWLWVQTNGTILRMAHHPF